GATGDKVYKYVNNNAALSNTTLNNLSIGNHNVTIYGKGSDGNTAQTNYTYFEIITPQQIASLKIDSLTELYSNDTLRIFEFVVTNNGSGAITNVQWWFDTNNSYIINSTINISSLAVGDSAFVYLEYNFSSTGSFTTKANASNGSLSDMKTFIVNISTAPVITAIPDITFNEDTYNDSLNLSDYVSDAEDPDSALTWTASNNVNVIVTISQTTKIANFTALANWSGSENIKFTVNDTSGLTANDTILVTVNPVNDAPTFNSSKQISNMTWPEDISNSSLNLSGYFYDIDGDALNYTSTGTSNLIVHINNNTGIVNLTPNANWTGIDYVVFIAKDPSGLTASSNNVTLNVTPVNDATSVSNITISINNNTGIVNFTPNPNFNGARYTIFTAIDALNITISSNNVTLNVTPVNDPPTIDSYVPLNLKPSVIAGSNLTFNHTSSDVDGDALSYSWKLDWIEKSTEQGWVYNSTINDLGTHNITLNVSDGIVNVSMQWNVTVINQTNINVYDFSILHQNSTLIVFGFSINNTGTVNLTNINWSLNTGPENIFANELFGLKPNESIFVFVEYAYPTTGDYNAIASATDGTYSDSESIAIEIEDIEVSNLSVAYSNATERIFELIIKNFLNTNLTNVSWTFDTKNSNVINSTITTTLQPNEEMFVYLDYNFTSTGTFNVNASARNGTLIDSRNLTITIS
ncbi:tandem-95 repeat protein, partial [Candidatus Woesearchaeota archaeon]|nr:tandem-95 repeat protein [Candidatus Woesearchaeota archaeon]